METSLYNRLCTIDTLMEAWLKVKRKNSKGGVDSVSVESFDLHAEENLQKILAQLMAQTYISMPMQKATKRKKDGSMRRLGMLTVSDKIVQLAVKMIIEPILEPTFLDVSYGFRPKKGPTKAIKRLRHIMNNQNRRWVVVCDISNNKRRRQVSRLLEEQGVRMNKSVFECFMSPVTYKKLIKAIGNKIDPKKDTVLYYPICKNCFEKSKKSWKIDYGSLIVTV